MIDENLCRAELSPADRAAQTARRKVIYEELHPETKHGTNQHGGVANFATPPAERFAAATAAAVGSSERIVQLNAERGEKVCPEALTLIRGTFLDTGTFLDKIKEAALGLKRVGDGATGSLMGAYWTAYAAGVPSDAPGASQAALRPSR